jgi:hypothetical protein
MNEPDRKMNETCQCRIIKETLETEKWKEAISQGLSLENEEFSENVGNSSTSDPDRMSLELVIRIMELFRAQRRLALLLDKTTIPKTFRKQDLHFMQYRSTLMMASKIFGHCDELLNIPEVLWSLRQKFGTITAFTELSDEEFIKFFEDGRD